MIGFEKIITLALMKALHPYRKMLDQAAEFKYYYNSLSVDEKNNMLTELVLKTKQLIPHTNYSGVFQFSKEHDKDIFKDLPIADVGGFVLNELIQRDVIAFYDILPINERNALVLIFQKDYEEFTPKQKGMFAKVDIMKENMKSMPNDFTDFVNS